MQRPSAGGSLQDTGSHRGVTLQRTESCSLSCCLMPNIMDIKKKKIARTRFSLCSHSDNAEVWAAGMVGTGLTPSGARLKEQSP